MIDLIQETDYYYEITFVEKYAFGLKKGWCVLGFKPFIRGGCGRMKTPEQATIVVNCLTEIFKKLKEGGKENV